MDFHCKTEIIKIIEKNMYIGQGAVNSKSISGLVQVYFLLMWHPLEGMEWGGDFAAHNLP